MSAKANKQTVEKMWTALGRMDWEALMSCLHPEVHYQDVPTDDPGARGPENVVKRLRVAFDHLSKQDQELHHIAADGDVDVPDEFFFVVDLFGQILGRQFKTG